jgi:hypothetical protein
MALSDPLAPGRSRGARVGVIGGPDVVDDIELLLGIRHGLTAAGLVTVNDPEDPRYKNTTDVASGGKEKTANLLAEVGDGLADPGRIDVPRPVVDAGSDQLDSRRRAVPGHHPDLAEPARLAQRLHGTEQRLVVERDEAVEPAEVGSLAATGGRRRRSPMSRRRRSSAVARQT